MYGARVVVFRGFLACDGCEFVSRVYAKSDCLSGFGGVFERVEHTFGARNVELAWLGSRIANLYPFTSGNGFRRVVTQLSPFEGSAQFVGECGRLVSMYGDKRTTRTGAACLACDLLAYLIDALLDGIFPRLTRAEATRAHDGFAWFSAVGVENDGVAPYTLSIRCRVMVGCHEFTVFVTFLDASAPRISARVLTFHVSVHFFVNSTVTVVFNVFRHSKSLVSRD